MRRWAGRGGQHAPTHPRLVSNLCCFHWRRVSRGGCAGAVCAGAGPPPAARSLWLSSPRGPGCPALNATPHVPRPPSTPLLPPIPEIHVAGAWAPSSGGDPRLLPPHKLGCMGQGARPSPLSAGGRALPARGGTAPWGDQPGWYSSPPIPGEESPPPSPRPHPIWGPQAPAAAQPRAIAILGKHPEGVGGGQGLREVREGEYW